MYNISMHAHISDISEFHLLLDFFGKSRRWNSASPRVYFFLFFFLIFLFLKDFPTKIEVKEGTLDIVLH